MNAADNIQISLSDAINLAQAAPTIIEKSKAGHSTEEILASVAPEIRSTLASIANLLAPGVGSGLNLLFKMVSLARRMTPEEENVWFDEASRNND